MFFVKPMMKQMKLNTFPQSKSVPRQPREKYHKIFSKGLQSVFIDFKRQKGKI